MKQYTKTHSNETALKNHVSKIKQRGGVCSINKLTVAYHFPNKKIDTKKYNTKAKRVKTVKQKGNIITFKTPFRWKGTEYSQILVHGFETQKGSVKIIGFGRDTNWFNSMDELLNAINWDLMEEWHS